MLPELRDGLESAAERRVRRAYPYWRLWKLMVTGAIVGGLILWLMSDIRVFQSAGCGAALLGLVAIAGMGAWWRRELRREMREILLDPQRCLKCGYPLMGLQSKRCPECGEPFLGTD